MENASPFRPGGNAEMLMASATVAANAAILISGLPSAEISLLVWNPSSALDAYIGIGATPGAAASNARFPTGSAIGSGGMTLPAPARVVTSYTINGSMWAAAISMSATGSPVALGNTPIVLIPGQGQ